MAKSDVGERLLHRARSSQTEGVERLIDPNNPPLRANQFGGQECNVADAAPDVEYAYSGGRSPLQLNTAA